MTREVALHDRILAATKATDLREWLDHLAWAEVLRPALEAERTFYQSMLVRATLGTEPTIRDTNGVVHTVTREHLAGRIQGIEWLLGFIERLLQKGERALDELNSMGYNIS